MIDGNGAPLRVRRYVVRLWDVRRMVETATTVDAYDAADAVTQVKIQIGRVYDAKGQPEPAAHVRGVEPAPDAKG